MSFGSGGWTKHNVDFYEPQGVYFLEKYDELFKLVVFGRKMYFTDQNGPKENHMEMNFEYFQFEKWILETEHEI